MALLIHPRTMPASLTKRLPSASKVEREARSVIDVALKNAVATPQGDCSIRGGCVNDGRRIGGVLVADEGR